MGNIDRRIAALPPEKLALLARRLGKGGTERRGAQIARVPRDGRPIPLSFAQQRLWFLHQLEPGNPFYNEPSSFRVRGPYDVVALARSLNEIVRRHEALRTTFEARDGEPVQVIAPSLHLPVPVVDLGALGASERESEVRRLSLEEGRQPFDLVHGPLLRARVLRLAEDDHVVLLTTHHIVSDGWSIGVFYQELAALHAAFAEGLPSPLPELPIQYADFAVWQRELLQGKVLEEHLAYWRAHLRGAPARLELPADRPRPPVQSFRGSTHALRLPRSLQQAVQVLSRKEGTTPFMTLLSAFGVLLSRCSRQSDLVIGSPIANRTRTELEKLIGFFVNTLALRLDLGGSPTFRELLGRAREVTLGAYAHQDLPFERLVEELSPERNLSHGPVFQVAFALQNIPGAEAGEAEGEAPADSPPPMEQGTAKFDLTLHMVESPRGLRGTFEYNTDLFDAGTIERMAEHFQVLLAAAIAAPDRRITELPLLRDEERHRLLAEWSATAAPRPHGRCIQKLFLEQVRRTPEAPALQFQGETLTYSELNTRANRLAHHLRSLGVGAEVRVGLCLDRSVEAVVAVLAVLKAGGAYVPLDPSYPAERLAFMVEDAGLSLLLTRRGLLERLPPGAEAPVVQLDMLDEVLAGQRDDDPAGGASAEDLAYLIYTSGSTGRPKGVAITHGNLAASTSARLHVYSRPAERYLLVTSLAFDSSVAGLFWPLCQGGALVVPPEEVGHDPGQLARIIAEEQVTHLLCVPSLYGLFLELEDASGALGSLNTVIVAGESCPPGLVARHHAVLPRARLYNEYGPTEATVWCSVHETQPEDGAAATVPIGRPIPGARLYVLDEERQPVPIGVPGEVFIGGAGVGRGYHGRAELTAERFVPDPFRGTAGGRLYRTGDLGRWLSSGRLEYLGRVDQQIKLRGHRIEAGEIEAVLGEHPAVQASVVVCREATPGHQELVAYLVEDAGFAARSEQRAELGEQLHGEWQSIFEEIYRQERPAAEALDTVGWTSSYTGELLPAEEMQRWAEASAARILGLGPKRVLEVGCGTGLILLRVAPQVERYVGTDFSPVVLEQLAAQVAERGLEGVRLERGDATELGSLGEGGFDVIVLSSVVQYFPSLDYLERVLEQALSLLGEGGAIFLGDVRSLPHLAMQHAGVQLHRAAAEASRGEVRAAMQRQLGLEQELVIHPGFFTSLPGRLRGLAGATVQLRRGRDSNEMTRFRYDVVIHKGSAGQERIQPAFLDAADWTAPLETLRRAVSAAGPEALVVTNLPNERVAGDLQALEWLEGAGSEAMAGALRAALAEGPAPGVDPEDVWSLGEALGYAVSIAWSGSDPRARFDVLFHRHKPVQVAPVIEGWPRSGAGGAAELATDPLAGRWERAVVRSVRAHLERRLPAYMVPASYVRLAALPLTPNGKVDRRALPAPERRMSAVQEVAPRTDDERRLARIWAEALGLERVGVTADFFELGGHSLLATQVISRIRTVFAVELPLRSLFEARTVQALLVEVRKAREAGPARPAITRLPRDGRGVTLATPATHKKS